MKSKRGILLSLILAVFGVSALWAQPTAEQAAAAIRACEAIGLDFAGVDVLFGDGEEPIVCEVNSNPHFKSTYECTGKDMSMRIMRYIAEALS